MHAYLITCYDNFSLLKKALELYDDERNDIYIHIDANTTSVDYEEILNTCNKSHVELIPRIRIAWGDTSIMRSQFNLMRWALLHGTYEYIHLLSGRDLPLKSQEEIHDFFRQNGGVNYYAIREYPPVSDEFANRVRHYMIFPDKVLYDGTFSTKLKLYVRHQFDRIQTVFKVDRLKKLNIELCKGAVWFSITQELCEYIVSQEEFCYKIFGKMTLFPDEFFLPTVIYNSKYRATLPDDVEGMDECLREIVWEKDNPRPHVWTIEDVEYLKNSKNLFARKFDENHMDVIDAICDYVKKQN